jgi:hypothetical protein
MKVLAGITEKALELHNNPIRYSLCMLSIFLNYPYHSGIFQLVLRWCPLITKIRLCRVNGFSDIDLLCLLSLERLRELEIVDYLYYEVCEVTLTGGLYPLLKEIGSSQAFMF